MLSNITSKHYFFFIYFSLSAVQVIAAYNFELFGDEAFYWLEGQFLAWSYSEIPGWVPWTMGLMDWVFPKHTFFVRLPGLIAALSIPWLGIFIARNLPVDKKECWLVGTLMMSLPVLGVAGVLGTADIWLVFFTLLAFATLLRALKSDHNRDFIFLGVVLLLGINTHLRFWVILLITALVSLWFLRAHKTTVRKLFVFSFPVMLTGLIPIILFNYQHDFPLLTFQLKDRHPWEFQTTHFSFFLTQILITTPWVFYLCLKNFSHLYKTSQNNILNNHPVLKIMAYTAVIHWLVYAIVGFYSDNLRLNVHWTLVTYALLLVPTVVNTQVSPSLKKWSAITGVLANFCLLLLLFYWLIWQNPQSTTNARITTNASGWQTLAKHTDQLLKNNHSKQLVVDHFMTLAQLKFYSNNNHLISTLEHPFNNKHGRAKQLEIMGLMQPSTVDEKLLVVEHSNLKLSAAVDFYLSACQQLNGIELIDSLDINQGLKTYYYFKTGNKNKYCEIPPLLYFEHKNGLLSGWVLQAKDTKIKLALYDAIDEKQLTKNIKTNTEPLGNNPIFRGLDPAQHQLLTYRISDLEAFNQTLQLQLERKNQVIYSQRLFLNH